MKTFIVLLLILFSFASNAQDNSGQNMKVETTDAHYPEGDQALTNYLFYNMKFSEEAKANKVQGDMMVSFFVEADSSLTNIKVITDLGYGCSDNMKALLEKVKYAPALVNGTPMRSKVIITVPVRAH